MTPRIELLWWEGCPSWERALQMLRGELERAGLEVADLALIEIRDEDDAARHGFPGSPTIRIDGEDLQPPAPEQPAGLTCRVYRRRDGSVSPLPDPDDLREAVGRAARGRIRERG